jgi:GTPase
MIQNNGADEVDFSQPRQTMVALATLGSVDGGKSSLLGVLTGGKLDDGNGSARKLIAKHPHEIASGQTSDVSTRSYHLTTRNETITLIDLAGHESYFKTTVSGASGHFPDYALLIVSANRNVLPMTKQHLRLLLSLSIPVIIVITHIDIAPREIYQDTRTGIEMTLKKFAGSKSRTLFVNDSTDYLPADCVDEERINNLKKLKINASRLALEAVMNTVDGKQMVFPVISLSNVTGFFVDVLRDCMEGMVPRKFWSPTDDIITSNNKIVKFFKLGMERLHPTPTLTHHRFPEYETFSGGVFYIDSAFNPSGIGLILTGINRGKTIRPGAELFLGPFGKEFKPFTVKSLHNNDRQIIDELPDHHRGCIQASKIEHNSKIVKRDDIRRGFIVLSDRSMVRNVCYRFKALITVFEGSITLKNGYSPVINMYTMRQTARMTIDPMDNNGEDTVRSNTDAKVALVTFKFKTHPELVYPYDIFIYRSGNIQGIGMITACVPIDEDSDAKPDPTKLKRVRRKNKIVAKQ